MEYLVKTTKGITHGEEQTPVQLEPMVYKMMVDDLEGKIYLTPFKDNFSLPEKIYGNVDRLVEKFAKARENLQGSLGILLEGLKGTGKSLTAFKYANYAISQNQPVILVDTRIRPIALKQFIGDLKSPCLVLFDEFEKYYDTLDQSRLLSLFDGVHQTNHTYMLVTNDPVSNHFIDRPGRIKYLISYDQLTMKVVKEVVTDLLDEDQSEWEKELLDVCERMKVRTFDTVTTLIEEVNLFGENPNSLIKDLNIEKRNLVSLSF